MPGTGPAMARGGLQLGDPGEEEERADEQDGDTGSPGGAAKVQSPAPLVRMLQGNEGEPEDRHQAVEDQ